LLRRDLNPFEELEGYLALLGQHLAGQPEFHAYCKNASPADGAARLLFAMRNAHACRRQKVSAALVNSVEELFRTVGATNWRSFTSHRLALRKLPEDVQQALREGWLDYTKATEIGRLV